jgi:hypothetical protein
MTKKKTLVKDSDTEKNNDVSTSRYKRVKLSAESVCVIKKALKAYVTQELEVERVTALAQLCHDDFFLVLYTYKKREHSHHRYALKKDINSTDQLPLAYIPSDKISEEN